MTRPASLLVLLFLALAPVWAEDLAGQADPTAPKNWKRYLLGTGPSLSVAMPSKPEKETTKEQFGTIDVYTSTEAGGGVFLAEVMNLTIDASKASPKERQEFFDAAFGAFKSSFEQSANMKLTVGKRTPMSISSVQGFQETYSGSGLNGTLQVVLGGKRGYMLATFVPAGDKSGHDAAFLKSAAIK
ncbi:MAG: hypothetical protein AB1758_28085 [Candidatus Eremiobacterota bacterium]